MRGGMYLGLSWASREAFIFNDAGKVLNDQLRSYDVMRFSETPEYLVDFVETPLVDGPYGARGIGEHGVIGMAGALANSLSTACEANLNQLPLTPELIWKTVKGGTKLSLLISNILSRHPQKKQQNDLNICVPKTKKSLIMVGVQSLLVVQEEMNLMLMPL